MSARESHLFLSPLIPLRCDLLCSAERNNGAVVGPRRGTDIGLYAHEEQASELYFPYTVSALGLWTATMIKVLPRKLLSDLISHLIAEGCHSKFTGKCLAYYLLPAIEELFWAR